MPQIYAKWRKVILLPVTMLFAVAVFAQAQVDTTLTPRFITTGPNSDGFYEYLPKGYVEGST